MHTHKPFATNVLGVSPETYDALNAPSDASASPQWHLFLIRTTSGACIISALSGSVSKARELAEGAVTEASDGVVTSSLYLGISAAGDVFLSI